jgi:hypothetical protein
VQKQEVINERENEEGYKIKEMAFVILELLVALGKKVMKIFMF